MDMQYIWQTPKIVIVIDSHLKMNHAQFLKIANKLSIQ